MNNWYNRINKVQPVQQPRFQSPSQKAHYIMQAMSNPAAFIQEQFPDIPENMRNNPNDILNYLQQTRGNKLTQDIQRICAMNSRR